MYYWSFWQAYPATYPKLFQPRFWAALPTATLLHIIHPSWLPRLWFTPCPPGLLVSWLSCHHLSLSLLTSHGQALGYTHSGLSQMSLALTIVSLLSTINFHLYHIQEQSCSSFFSFFFFLFILLIQLGILNSIFSEDTERARRQGGLPRGPVYREEKAGSLCRLHFESHVEIQE